MNASDKLIKKQIPAVPSETSEKRSPGKGGEDVDSPGESTCSLQDSDLLIDLADVFKIFGDSTRLSIMTALRTRELCVSDLASLLHMTSSAISHQLRMLRTFNLVRYRRDGKMSYYSLADQHVHTIIEAGLEHLEEER